MMSTEVKIEAGLAIHMGDDAFTLIQDAEDGPQSVVVTADDLRRLLALLG